MAALGTPIPQTLVGCDRCTKGVPPKAAVWNRDEGLLCDHCHRTALAHWHIRQAHWHLKALGEPCVCEEFHQ